MGILTVTFIGSYMLLQAQQQGLIAAMKALDSIPWSSLHDCSITADTARNSVDRPSQPQGQNIRKTNAYRQQRNDAVASKAAESSDPLTVSVTPIPSDDRSSSPNPFAETDDRDEGRFGGRLMERNNSGVRRALTELQQLRRDFTNRRFLRVPPPSVDETPVGKENRESGPPRAPAGRLFGSLIDSLRRMNSELGGGRCRSSTLPPVSSAPFRLLHLPTPREHGFPVKFPQVMPPPPRPAWQPAREKPPPAESRPMPAVCEQAARGNESRQMPSSDFDLPLLRISDDRVPSSDGRDPQSLDALPFPMLQMVDPRQRRGPFFVPPENMICRDSAGVRATSGAALGSNNNNGTKSTNAASTAKSEHQTGRSDAPDSSRRSLELLRLNPCLTSESDGVTESDTRYSRLISILSAL